MKSQWMVITPAMAKEWLETRNTANRGLLRNRVLQYTADMQNGTWIPNHQGIAFYDDGTLFDGQHRLAACVESGVNLQTQVTFGMQKEAAIGVDCHRARDLKDNIRLAGLSNWIGRAEQSLARVAHTLSYGTRTVMTAHEVVSFCDLNREAITAAIGAIKTKTRRLSTASVGYAMACAYPFVGGAPTLARFSKVLTSGVPSELGGLDDVAALRLRERLLITPTGGDVVRSQSIKLTMRALKAFNDKERLARIVEPTEYLYPLLKITPDEGSVPTLSGIGE